jgi:hypothetical protein
MTKIRQEFNLLNRYKHVDGVNTDLLEIVRISPEDFNGSVTFHWEVVARNTESNRNNIFSLLQSDDPLTGWASVDSVVIPQDTMSYTRYRETYVIGLSTTNIYYRVDVNASIYVDAEIVSAKIIILQDATDITDTQTQIEVGVYQSDTSTAVENTYFPVDYPKYWKYESAKWDPTPEFKLGFTYLIENDAATIVVALEYDDGSFNWSGNVVGATIVTSETVDYQESAAFTPTDGLHYRLVYRTSNDMYAMDIYNAKVIATQVSVDQMLEYATYGIENLYGGTGSFEGVGQSFTPSVTQSVNTISFYMSKWGTPTDNVYLEISDSMNGSAITNGTSNDVAVSTLPTAAEGGRWIRFTFPTAPTLTGSTEYFCRIYRDGSRDTSNYPRVSLRGSNPYSGGAEIEKDSGTWVYTSGSNEDCVFRVHYGAISKLQPEYLLVNENQSDTGLQEFQTYFDPDEWDGVDNTYYHEHSASGTGSNTKLISGDSQVSHNTYETGVWDWLYGGSGTYEEQGQSFSSGGGFDLKAVGFYFTKYGSPTDNLKVELAATIDGSTIATTATVSMSNINDEDLVIFEFSSAQTLTASTTYYLRIKRDGSRDTSNFCGPYFDSTVGYSGGQKYVKASGTWSGESSYDLAFILWDETYGGEITNSNITGNDLYRMPTFEYADVIEHLGTYYDVWTDGTFIYTACGSSGVRSYSVAIDGTLTLEDTNYSAGTYSGVWHDGTWLFVANWEHGLRVLSVDSAGDFTYKDLDDQGGTYDKVWGDGSYIYVAAGTIGLLSYSVDGSGILTYEDVDDQGGDYSGVHGDGTFVFAAAGSIGLVSYTVDGAGDFTYKDVDKQGSANYERVWSDGTFIFCACLGDGIRSYSVNGSGVLSHIDVDDQGGTYYDVWSDGNYIYAACDTDGVRRYTVDGSGNLTYVDVDDQGSAGYRAIHGDGVSFLFAACAGDGLRSYLSNEGLVMPSTAKEIDSYIITA